MSFQTAKDLRARVEILPKSPEWKCKRIITVYPTKSPIHLFYRDPLECIQSLLESPLVKDYIHFTPLRIFKTAEKLVRIYNEWLTGDAAWEMQVSCVPNIYPVTYSNLSLQSKLPPGATLLGTILSSDKTNISAMTGNRIAHPLLISLANLDMEFLMKASHQAFVLLSLLPIPQFLHRKKEVCSVLEYRLMHQCFDFILAPLKTAARIGVMMSDPLGWRRYSFTTLASCIIDTPESALYSGVAGKTSSVTTASYKEFGDGFQHPPRTAKYMLRKLRKIRRKVHPWDIEKYIREAKQLRLNGVHLPFWRDWTGAKPPLIYTPEPLHHWHKCFWDHDAKWCIRLLGNAEIDFRFSILHPHSGFRHFKEGISKLKQVTGREHRDIQRYIVSVIAGAAPDDFVIAVRSLTEFRYRGQALEHDDESLDRISSALEEFHSHKESVMTAGVRVGKGNRPINNWHIPKLEFMQSVVSNIQANGTPSKFSADRTENAHITEVKDPARSGNNQNYEDQICRFLDRREKCRRFDLATAIHEAGISFVESMPDNDHTDCESDDDNTCRLTSTTSLLEQIDPVSSLGSSTRITANYFTVASKLCRSEDPKAPLPLRTFVDHTKNTAFHLNRHASFKMMSVDEAAALYQIADLRPALADFLERVKSGVTTHTVAGRRKALQNAALPFDTLQIWCNFRIQSKSYYPPHNLLQPQTVNASPPSDQTAWTFGRYDPIILNTDSASQWPRCGLTGKVYSILPHIVVTGLSRPSRCPSLHGFTCGTSAWLPFCSGYRSVFVLCSAV